ncbi:hypothetical protein PZA11_006263 [Diplocarpon coronariae]
MSGGIIREGHFDSPRSPRASPCRGAQSRPLPPVLRMQRVSMHARTNPSLHPPRLVLREPPPAREEQTSPSRTRSRVGQPRHPTTRARQEHRLELSPSSPQRDHDLQRRRMILFPGLETVNPRPEDGRKSFFLSCPTPAARRGGALWEHTLCFRQRLFSPQKSARIRTADRCHSSGKVGVSFTLRGICNETQDRAGSK